MENDSDRNLTIKIMKKGKYSDSKVVSFIIAPWSYRKQSVSQTGYYYLKTKGKLYGKRTVYKKGDPFEVYNGHDGYSEITISYSITESKTGNPIDGDEISEEEFKRDYWLIQIVIHNDQSFALFIICYGISLFSLKGSSFWF